MAKYSNGFKLIIVTEYLEGSLGYKLLARKYVMPSVSPIKGWVNACKAFDKVILSGFSS